MTPAVRGGLDSKGKSKLISGIAEQWPRHRTFVETGSACGDQVLLLAERFDRLVTIEMDADYFQSAQHRTRYYGNVQVIHGDSAQVLPRVLREVGPSVVFLDAHEIADAGQSALRAEMEALGECPDHHVILVDDARLTSSERGWVSLDELADWAEFNDYRPPYVRHDVVHLLPEDDA